MSFTDQDAQHARELEEKRVAKIRARQFASDVREVFAQPQARRLLAAFLADAGSDVSALRRDNLTTGHAIGWQDAAGWWLNALRLHCHEREVQMRAEARKEAAQGASQDQSDD